MLHTQEILKLCTSGRVSTPSSRLFGASSVVPTVSWGQSHREAGLMANRNPRVLACFPGVTYFRHRKDLILPHRCPCSSGFLGFLMLCFLVCCLSWRKTL
jgi:hypothetical protein